MLECGSVVAKFKVKISKWKMTMQNVKFLEIL